MMTCLIGEDGLVGEDGLKEGIVYRFWTFLHNISVHIILEASGSHRKVWCCISFLEWHQ